MIGTALSGERCQHCKRVFAHGERVNLVGNKAYCPSGTGCTQRVTGLALVKPSGLTGPLHARFVATKAPPAD